MTHHDAICSDRGMTKANVMVVDDDPSILRLIQANLEVRGFDVTPASDGESALELCEQALPDVVLLDITLPGINGLEVCRRIRQWSNVPIIIISAAVGTDCRDTVLELGANDYITKPFGVDKLVTHLREVLEQNHNVDASISNGRAYSGVKDRPRGSAKWKK